MSKTILIKEDSLQTIKEKVVDNSNIINPNDVCVNEAAPEVDEYTIGGETDSPVGGRYYHASEENNNIVTESKNSNRAHRQTRQIIAKYMGTDENDPTVAKVEAEFEAKMFDEGKRTDWMIVLEPIAYNWYLESEDINLVKKYVNYIYLKATETTPPSAYIANVKKLGSFNEVKQFLDQQKKADNDASMEAQNNMEHNLNQNYEVRGPLNFDEAYYFGKESCPGGEICYTQDEDVWESEEYGNYDSKKCYVLLRNDWENIPAEHDGSEANNGFPAPLNQYNGYDSYGLSMIFVWIGKLGNLAVSNTRWNHNANYAPGHGVDLALKEIDIARLMGVPFEQVFGIKKVDINSYVKENLANSMVTLDEIFDDVFEEYDNIQAIKLGNKYNYIVHEKHPDSSHSWYLLWDKPYEEWFEWAKPFEFGIKYTFVMLHHAENDVRVFSNDGILYGFVEGIEKRLKIENPVYIFDDVTDFTGYDNFIKVRLFGRYNFINRKTKELLWKRPFNDWLTYVDNFREGFARIKLNGKYNYVNKDGRIISDQWFDIVLDFRNGFAAVRLNGKYNYVNQDGRIVSGQWFDNVRDFSEGFAAVRLNGKSNFINQEGELLSDQWFDKVRDFSEGFAVVELNGKHYKLDTNGNLTLLESNNKNKKILVFENQLKAIKENIEPEVESSEVDLSSFKKKDSLVPSIWKDEDTLNSKVRLKLLDIADDFWEFVNITWVEPKGIILTGSICNFNWSKFSDIDLHLIVDFDEIDDRDDFVRDYMDTKKNEWNNEHKSLKIMDYPVELYVQNIDEIPEAGGIYDLEENKWLRKPNKDDIKPIGLNKFSIKDRAATIMTIIDDMWDVLNSTDDMYDIRQLGKDASKLWDKVKKMRKNSLSKNGEGGAGNIVYKVMRRMGYLDKIFDLRSAIYDKLNSVTEATKQYKKLITEEIVADGNAEHNPFEKRWKAERQALKNFLVNCGKIMTSKENGKQYKVYFDQSISNLIGYNYCICVQWNPIEMKPESTIYIRALDKFTNRIFQAQYDDRGKDNMRGTYDDTGYSQRFEAKRITKQMLTEANNKKRFKRQTLNVLAQGLGLDPNDPQLQSLESDFRNVYFGHLSNQEIDRVIGYEPLFAKCALDLGFPNNDYNDTEFTKYVNYLILNTKDKPNYTEIINHYKSNVSSFDDMRNVVGGEIKASKEANAEQQANMGSNINPNYQVLGPLTFDEAKRYGNRSGRAAGEDGRICYSQYEDTWLSQNYSNKNKNKCYILLRNDWQHLKGFEHDGSEANNGLGELSEYNAYDNYGLSMIMLFINPEGELHECNVRWNHGINGITKFGPGRSVDHALTEMDIANIMGIPFEQVFNVKKVDIIDNIKKHLANGEKPWDIFDYFSGMELGFGVVELNTTYGKKWNYLTEDGDLLWDKPLKEWFDSCSEWDYENEVGLFRIGGKYNFIKSDGTLLLRGEEYPDKTNWPDYMSNFKDMVNFDIPVATANFGLHWVYLGLDGKLYDYRGNLEA